MRLKLTIIAFVTATMTLVTTIHQAEAQGLVREWTNASGGEFHFPFNWTGGVPFQDDDALFDLPGTFTVDLTGMAEINNLLLERGEVTFAGENSLSAGEATIRGSMKLTSGVTMDITGDLTLRTSLAMDREVLVRGGTTLYSGDAIAGGLMGNIVTVNVEDESAWVTDNLFLGTMGIVPGVGSIFVTDLGRINVGDENTIFDGISVGATGFDARLSIGNGSTIGSSTTPVRIGLTVGQTGIANVLDTGTEMTASQLTVGLASQGTLNVTGGQVEASTMTIGLNPFASGDATFAGDTANGDFDGVVVGSSGTGNLLVELGADFSAASLQIGGSGASAGQGIMTVDDSQAFANTACVGCGGDGQLLLSSGGLLLGIGDTTVADGMGSLGTVHVSGDSVLSVDSIAIGNGGIADVTIEDSVITAQGDISVSELSTFDVSTSVVNIGGTLTVDGVMVFRDSSSMQLTPFATNPIMLTGSGRMEVNNNSASFFDDVTNLGLEIRTGSDNESRFLANYSGSGSFTGAGSVEFRGNVDLVSGPAVTTFEGDVELSSSSTLMVDLGGVQSGEFDRIQIAGNLNIGGASLTGSFVDGFTLGTAQQFVIITVQGNVVGQFAGLPEGAVIASPGGIDLSITYTGGDGNDIALISEEFLAGDVNCDGEVNLLDVSPFVLVLTSGGFNSKGDINGDGVLSLLDVQPFVNILSGG